MRPIPIVTSTTENDYRTEMLTVWVVALFMLNCSGIALLGAMPAGTATFT
jgi:hypothetical protein